MHICPQEIGVLMLMFDALSPYIFVLYYKLKFVIILCWTLMILKISPFKQKFNKG